MVRRWLIRSLFLLPLVCVVGVWMTSYWQVASITRNSDGRRWHLAIVWGECEGQLAPVEYNEVRTWKWFNQPVQNGDGIGLNSQMEPYGFAGFGFTRYQASWGVFWDVKIPLWFPTLLSTLLLWFVWRKTRPRLEGRAFPVEPAKTPADSK